MKRAVWCDIARDFPNLGEIEKHVDWCGRHSIGISFPCINHATGLVTYPSDVAPRAAAYDEWDPMPDLVRLCGAAGIELHIWVVNAHWGPQRYDADSKIRPSSRGPRPLQETHRDWFTVNHLGQNVLDEGAGGEAIHGGGFLNLGLPPVQEFQERLFAELLDRYEVDGVHLDYIRSNFQNEDWTIEVPAANKVWAAAEVGDILQVLPRSGNPRKAAPGGFRAVEVLGVEELAAAGGRKAQRRLLLRHAGRYGFNDPAMRAFEKETGLAYFAAGSDTPERVSWLYRHHRDDWHIWKRGRITELVRRLSAVTHDRQRKLSAAVFDSIPWCRQEIAQDWSVWCNEKLLDFVCPMDYGKRAPELAECIRAQDGHLLEPRVPSLAGILTGCNIIDLSREDLTACEEAARSLGQAGISLYCYGTFRRLLE
jgi:uncharacterized lipoprotein YddW (UPF0748 family)